jgi:uncharacterized protein (TIGR03067 family)
VRTLLSLALAAVFAVAAPVPKPVKKPDDASLLEGRWESVTVDTGRGPLADTAWWIEFKDGKLSTGNGSTNGYSGRAFKLDPAASPKHLDIDNLQGQHHLTIYEIDGDTLKWCESQSTFSRPTEFKSSADGKCCFVFKRVEKKDK